MANTKKSPIFGASHEGFNRGYDIIGSIAIVKFDRSVKNAEKKKFADDFLREHRNIKTVLEKTGKFSGRLRVQKTKYLAGEKTKEALHKESGCIFRLNVESCYFSPRLSNERAEISEIVKKDENVLVLFGGVAPFAIAVAKTKKPRKVISIELGRECNRYAADNIKRNKVSDKVGLIQGDVRKILPKMKENTKKSSIFGASKTKRFEVFDRIVMARPNLKDSFLDVTFPHIKKGGMIHYYGFYKESEVDKMSEMIEQEASKAKKKIKIMKIKKSGDIGPYKFRYRADIKVLN